MVQNVAISSTRGNNIWTNLRLKVILVLGLTFYLLFGELQNMRAPAGLQVIELEVDLPDRPTTNEGSL